MNMLTKLFLLAVALMVTLWGCSSHTGPKKGERCDDRNPETFTISIIPGNGKQPIAEPDRIKACFQDEIEFKGEDETNEFEILFVDDSPFKEKDGKPKKKLKSKEGKTKEKVAVNPKKEEIEYKYDVNMTYPKRLLLDPIIVITPQ